jgi:hypothetical protein
MTAPVPRFVTVFPAPSPWPRFLNRALTASLACSLLTSAFCPPPSAYCPLEDSMRQVEGEFLGRIGSGLHVS